MMQGTASNRRPAGQADGSDNFAATLAADRALPAAVAELTRVVELRREQRVVRKLSLSQIAKLPEDAAGYRIVRVKD